MVAFRGCPTGPICSGPHSRCWRAGIRAGLRRVIPHLVEIGDMGGRFGFPCFW